MAMSTSSAGLLRPEDVHELIVQPVVRQSVAMQVATLVRTDRNSYRIPAITADAAAGWYAEGGEITATDATIAEIDVVPAKLAGLTVISRELAADSSPEASAMIGESLARDIAAKLDSAFFAKTTANGPSGLLNITPSTVDTRAATALSATTGEADDETFTTTADHGLALGDVVLFSALTGGTGLAVDTPYWVKTIPTTKTFTLSATPGGETAAFSTDVSACTVYKRVLANLDAFAEGIATAETAGCVVDHFVLNPADLLALAKLKKLTSGSNEPLLGADPTMPTRRTALGVPLIPTTAVKVGTVWAIPRDRAFVVMRQDVQLDVDQSAYFAYDSIGVRASMRVGFGFPHQAAIVRLY